MSKERVGYLPSIGRHVGLLYSFCANGLRIGVFVSQHNPELITTLSGTGFFVKGKLVYSRYRIVAARANPAYTSVSSMADAIWSHILKDREWLDWFLAENKKRLGEAAHFTREWFEERGVPVARCNA